MILSESTGGAAGAATREAYLVDALDLGAAMLTVALLVTTALDGGGPAAVALAVAFVTFVPGWALLGWVPIAVGASRVALAVLVSLTLCTATSQSVLWLHLWRPAVLLFALGLPSLIALCAHLLLNGVVFGVTSPR